MVTQRCRITMAIDGREPGAGAVDGGDGRAVLRERRLEQLARIRLIVDDEHVHAAQQIDAASPA